MAAAAAEFVAATCRGSSGQIDVGLEAGGRRRSLFRSPRDFEARTSSVPVAPAAAFPVAKETAPVAVSKTKPNERIPLFSAPVKPVLPLKEEPGSP